MLYRRQWRPKQPITAEIMKRREARAELIAEIYHRMNVQAVAVGALELTLGKKTLKRIMRKHKLPLLSANLQDPAGKAIFPAHTVAQVAGVKFGIFGLTGAHGMYRDLIDEKKFKLGDAKAAAQDQVKALRAKGAQIVIALAAVGHQNAQKIADAVQGIDFMFVSGTGRHREELERRKGTFLTEMTREGKFIGHLTLHIRGNKLQFEDLSERYMLAQRLERITKSVESLKQRMPSAQQRGRGEWMEKRLVRAEDSKKRLMVQLHKANQRQPTGSFATNVLKACELTLPEDKGIAQLVTQVAKDAGLQRPRGAH